MNPARSSAVVILFSCAILAAQSASGQSSAAQGTGGIQGTVLDAVSGKPVGGVLITALRAGLPPFKQRSRSAFDGSFQVQGLTAGTYTLCAQPPADGYLDTCAWRSKPTPLTLTDGQQSTGNAVKLRAGSVVQVSVQDAQQLLAQNTAAGSGQHLVVGVWGPDGIFYAAHSVAASATNLMYRLTVPFDTPLKFSISSATLTLAGSTGQSLASNADAKPFQQSITSSVQPNFQYSITGLAH